MPKMKTNRAAAKRFRRTGGGFVKRGSAYRRHLLTKKSSDRKRRLRGTQYIHQTDMKELRALLPN